MTTSPSPVRRVQRAGRAAGTGATPLAHLHGDHATAQDVGAIMKRVGRAIRTMELPAIEKLQEDNAATAFQTLVSTMLSAQTRDAVTHAASLRLFARADTPETLAALTDAHHRALIYPVSFYRNKAAAREGDRPRHRRAIRRTDAADDGGAADAARRRTEDGDARVDRRARERRPHLRRHPRAPHLEPASGGCGRRRPRKRNSRSTRWRRSGGGRTSTCTS